MFLFLFLFSFIYLYHFCFVVTFSDMKDFPSQVSKWCNDKVSDILQWDMILVQNLLYNFASKCPCFISRILWASDVLLASSPCQDHCVGQVSSTLYWLIATVDSFQPIQILFLHQAIDDGEEQVLGNYQWLETQHIINSTSLGIVRKHFMLMFLFCNIQLALQYRRQWLWQKS